MTDFKIIAGSRMTPNFIIVVNVLLPICCHIGVGMPSLCIFVEGYYAFFSALTIKEE